MFPTEPHSRSLAGQLAHALPVLDAAQTNEAAMAFWQAHPGQESAAVVREGRPVGLLNRHAFMEVWAQPFKRELFGRKACESWMDAAPLVVDAGLPLRELAARAVQAGTRALAHGFITVAADGRYHGIGTGLALLEATSAAEAARARDVRASIEYASHIQRAQLEVSARELARACPDHALLWEPRDVVGGDCYFFRAHPRGLVGAVLDCTGHGVPGAFMTLIALSVLERAVEEAGAALPDPGALLGALNAGIKRALGQREGEGGSRDGSDDGLDGAAFVLPEGGRLMAWAGARLPLFVVRGERVDVLEPSRVSVGYRDTPGDARWQTQALVLPQGALVALMTDGLPDQVGGLKGIPLGRRRIAETLSACAGLPAAEAAHTLRRVLADWQREEPRRDDLTALLLSPRGGA